MLHDSRNGEIPERELFECLSPEIQKNIPLAAEDFDDLSFEAQLAFREMAKNLVSEKIKRSGNKEGLKKLADKSRKQISKIDGLMEENTHLERQATFDGLTNLLTRKRGDEILMEEVERAMREKTIFSVVLADLDHFKNVNDTFGHAAGDAVLRLASEKIKASVREYDSCIRYGGEELAVILPGADEKVAAEVAERIREAFEEAVIEFAGDEINFTASLGVAELSPEILEELKNQKLPPKEFLGQIYDCADRALYSAKRGGRNQVICCSEVLSGDVVAA